MKRWWGYSKHEMGKCIERQAYEIHRLGLQLEVAQAGEAQAREDWAHDVNQLQDELAVALRHKQLAQERIEQLNLLLLRSYFTQATDEVSG